jgi:hypothetical protein
MKKILFILIILSIAVAVYPLLHFTDNADGTVRDNSTGLVWMKCNAGQIYTHPICNSIPVMPMWSAALTECNNLTLGARSWRLPNVNELKSLVDISRSNPAIHKGFFPPTVSGGYWTSTTYPNSQTSAFIVNFTNGVVTIGNKTTSYNVRCVSGP